MAEFKVIVRERREETSSARSSYEANGNTKGCAEISDFYEDDYYFKIQDGRLAVLEKGGDKVISVYQEWSRVVSKIPVKKDSK
jgi:hypothetical protein